MEVNGSKSSSPSQRVVRMPMPMTEPLPAPTNFAAAADRFRTLCLDGEEATTKNILLGCIDQRTKDFILHFHCIQDIPRLQKNYSTHPLSWLSHYEFSIHHYSRSTIRSIIRMSSGHLTGQISSHCCWVAGSTYKRHWKPIYRSQRWGKVLEDLEDPTQEINTNQKKWSRS